MGSEAEKDGLHALWREAAVKEIEGCDWPRIVLDLFAELDALTERLDRLRRHVISDPEMRALHENAKAYSLAVQALNKKRGGPLSTTLAFLIEQDYLIPNDPRKTRLIPPGERSTEEDRRDG